LAGKFRRLVDGFIAIIGESSWVLLCFFLVAAAVFGVVLPQIPAIEQLFDTTIGQLLAGGLIYALVLFLVILPVWALRNFPYVLKVLGVSKKPTREILWLPAVMWLAYMGATIAAALLANLAPWIDMDQVQETGFQDLGLPAEYVVAFIALVILPPIAEELVFRGYLFGRLREKLGFWMSAIVVSIVFGVVHMQWNVGVDVAVLSLFLCYLRERTGSIWASVVLHALKNGVAYFLLFIAPLLGMNIR
jgi:uncharacterized protein